MFQSPVPEGIPRSHLLHTPESEICRVAEFLDRVPSASLMLAVIDPNLYRNRKSIHAADRILSAKAD